MQTFSQEIKAEINVTPLVDVVLVLLIIFMVVTPMIVSRNVQLPVTAKPGSEPQQIKKIVYLTSNGDLFFEDVPVIEDILTGRLQELHRRSPDTKILLHADRRLRYDKVMQTLDLISSSGFSEIGLVAQPLSSQTGTRAP